MKTFLVLLGLAVLGATMVCKTLTTPQDPKAGQSVASKAASLPSILRDLAKQ